MKSYMPVWVVFEMVFEEAIKGILNIKPSWKISGFDRIVIQPLSFAAVPNEILLDISEKELFKWLMYCPILAG